LIDLVGLDCIIIAAAASRWTTVCSVAVTTL
jgi:hypothetical protein